MSSEEIRELVRKTVKEILEQEPEIILETLTKNPNILQEALAKAAPWTTLLKAIHDLEERMATREDLEDIRSVMATKDDLKKLEETMATKKDLRVLEGRMATKDELEGIRSVMATKEDLEKLATKDELERIRRAMATKEELEKIRAIMATKDDLRRLENMVAGLGARWGVMSESAYREGLKEILRDAGWTVESLVVTDVKGIVYGRPEEVEIDIVVRDGKVYIVEITSALKRSDLAFISRKAKLYREAKGVEPDRIIVITPFIHDKNPDRIKAIAREMNIDIVYPHPPE